ncbi:hypothetical protein [Stratiformator vulcanicus]|nr:hypothetical protein [Stratiformator vulcanicus]
MSKFFNSDRFQSYGIVLFAVLAAMTYGVAHDMVTARIAIDYFFPPYHPVLVESRNPNIVALAWGTAATWWVGLMLGVPLAISARVGPWPKLSLRNVLPLVAGLFGTSAIAAATMGSLSYSRLGNEIEAVWTAHNTSYTVGFLGGIAVCVIAGMIRLRKQQVQSRQELTASFEANTLADPTSDVECESKSLPPAEPQS